MSANANHIDVRGGYRPVLGKRPGGSQLLQTTAGSGHQYYLFVRHALFTPWPILPRIFPISSIAAIIRASQRIYYQ